MAGFGVLLKLQKLLSKHNVELLWTIMSGLADPKNPAFNTFWRWYAETRGGSIEDVTVGAKLVEQLRNVLREYLASEK